MFHPSRSKDTNWVGRRVKELALRAADWPVLASAYRNPARSPADLARPARPLPIVKLQCFSTYQTIALLSPPPLTASVILADLQREPRRTLPSLFFHPLFLPRTRPFILWRSRALGVAGLQVA